MDADVHVCRGPYLRKSEVLNIIALRSLDPLALLHTDLISAFFLDSWEIPNSYVQTGHIIDFSAPTTTCCANCFSSVFSSKWIPAKLPSIVFASVSLK